MNPLAALGPAMAAEMPCACVSPFTQVPISGSTTLALSDAADVCARALHRWRQVLAEQSALLTRLAEKVDVTSSLPSSALTLAAAGLPVRLLHVRVQSNLHALETQVRKFLAPFAQFQAWARTHAEPDGEPSDSASRACHRALCLVSQLHELCDLQADATRGFDAQLHALPISESAASFPVGVLHQMRDITSSMDKLSHTLWRTLAPLLGTSPSGNAASHIAHPDESHPAPARAADEDEWVSEVNQTNDEAISYLDTCLSPPTRHGSVDPHTAVVWVASPSPRAEHLHGYDHNAKENEDDMRPGGGHRPRAHSRRSPTASASPFSTPGTREHVSRELALPSLSPWRPEDEAAEQEATREVKGAVASRSRTATTVAPLRTRNTTNTNAMSPKRADKDRPRRQTAVTSTDAHQNATELREATRPPTDAALREAAADEEPGWSIPPPLGSRAARAHVNADLVSESAPHRRLTSQPPPSTSSGPNRSGCGNETNQESDVAYGDGEAVQDEGTRDRVATDQTPLAMARTSREDGADRTERIRPSPRASPSSSSPCSSPSSPLTHQALQALRTSYDRKAARLEAALRERESVIAELQRTHVAPLFSAKAALPPTAPAATTVEDRSSAATAYPHSVPCCAHGAAATPMAWYGFPPPSYAAPSVVAAPALIDPSVNQSLAHLQQELDTVRQQQAHILALLQSAHPNGTDTASAAMSTTAKTDGAARPPREPTTTRTAAADDRRELVSAECDDGETNADTSTQRRWRESEARNARLQRDNIHLKKRLFALELDLRRAAHPDRLRTSTQAEAAKTRSAAVTAQLRDDSPQPHNTSSYVLPPSSSSRAHERHRAVLEKLFAQRQGSLGAGSGADIVADVEGVWAGTMHKSLPTRVRTRSSVRAPDGPSGTALSTSSFFARHSFFPFAVQGDGSTYAAARASSAPPKPSSVRSGFSGHVYDTSMNTTTTSKTSTSVLRADRRGGDGYVSHLTPSVRRASSSSPPLRHHAWRLGHDDVEEAALELLSHPIGSHTERAPTQHGSARTAHTSLDGPHRSGTPDAATVVSAYTDRHGHRLDRHHAVAQRGDERGGHESFGETGRRRETDSDVHAQGSEVRHSPLQVQRARVWHRLHQLSSPSSADKTSADLTPRRSSAPAVLDEVTISPMTDVDSKDRAAAASSSAMESEADIVSVTVEPAPRRPRDPSREEAARTREMTSDVNTRFPLPAYMSAPTPPQYHAHSVSSYPGVRGDEGGSEDDGGGSDKSGLPLALTVLDSPPPRPARSRRHRREEGKADGHEAPTSLYDPLTRENTARHALPRSLPHSRAGSGLVDRRLTLSRSRSVSTSSPSPPPPPPNGRSASSAASTRSSRTPSIPPAHMSMPRPSAEPSEVRGRSRTLPPTNQSRHTVHQSDPPRRPQALRPGHAKEDLMETLESERSSLTATLTVLHSQREQVSAKRQSLHQLLSAARGDPRRTADLLRLLERLEEASDAVASKVAELYARRDHVSRQLQLLHDDAY